MPKWLIILLVVLGVCVGGLVLCGVMLFSFVSGTYNKLNGLNQNVEAKWGQVQNVYQRRLDLVPNLVAVVEGAAGHEKSTFVEVAKARASVGQITVDAKTLSGDLEQQKKFLEAQQGLSGALSRMMVVAEQYPTLKANDNFRDLQTQLEGTENRIAVERRESQLAIQEYNTLVGGFMSGMVADHYGFKKAAYFVAEESAQKAPVVKFNEK